MSATSPTETSPLPIELAWSSQRPELRDAKEDWTGVTNPVARRKLQNRLNQRARRRRKDRQLSADSKSTDSAKSVPTKASNSSNDDDPPGTSSNHNSPGPLPRAVWRCTSSSPRVQSLMERFSNHAYASYLQGAPSLSHLSLLVKFNVTSALQHNAEILGILDEYRKWEGVSPLNKSGPQLSRAASQPWPANLQPTPLQRSIEHHPWVDTFPWPRLRDNLLQAFEHPDFCDEDELCHDVCELANEDMKPTLVVWGPSYDPRSWEVTTSFLNKWGWLLSGCMEIIESTNYWRAKRGEQPLSFMEVRDAIRLSMPRRSR